MRNTGEKEERSRFGKDAIKSKNIAVQALVLLPLTGAQLWLWTYIVLLSESDNSDKSILIELLCVVGIFILSIINAKIRGHSASYEYYNTHRQYSKGLTNTVDVDMPYTKEEVERMENDQYSDDFTRYDMEANERDVDERMRKAGYKKLSGGWSVGISFATICCFLLSPVMVFFQAISLLIAIVTNPYRGIIYSWFGFDDAFKYCHAKVLQVILHFFFGFIILPFHVSPKYSEIKTEEKIEAEKKQKQHVLLVVLILNVLAMIIGLAIAISQIPRLKNNTNNWQFEGRVCVEATTQYCVQDTSHLQHLIA